MPSKRKQDTMEEALQRQWCYYCDREFPLVTDLCDHQRMTHFKCSHNPRECNRKLQTVGGLKVHMLQVHKCDLKAVPFARPGRESIDLEIFAMQGIPERVLEQRNDAIIMAYRLAEAEHLKKTGNPLSGNNGPNKKQKVEMEAVANLEAHQAAARIFKEKKNMQRKLIADAIARGEEPPVFDTNAPVKAVPVAQPSPTINHGAPAAAPVTAPITAPAPSRSATSWSPPQLDNHGAPPQWNRYPAPQAHGHTLPVSSTRLEQDAAAADSFRQQHPMHGLPSIPVQTPNPSFAPPGPFQHALPRPPSKYILPPLDRQCANVRRSNRADRHHDR